MGFRIAIGGGGGGGEEDGLPPSSPPLLLVAKEERSLPLIDRPDRRLREGWRFGIVLVFKGNGERCLGARFDDF